MPLTVRESPESRGKICGHDGKVPFGQGKSREPPAATRGAVLDVSSDGAEVAHDRRQLSVRRYQVRVLKDKCVLLGGLLGECTQESSVTASEMRGRTGYCPSDEKKHIEVSRERTVALIKGPVRADDPLVLYAEDRDASCAAV